MITRKELNPHGYSEIPEIAANLDKLLIAINIIRKAYGLVMIVTSGLRSMADQLRINPSAPKSKHLIGAAVDIQDKDGKLAEWCKKNIKLLEAAGLYCEDFASTVGWVHFQYIAPKSGKRIFIP